MEVYWDQKQMTNFLQNICFCVEQKNETTGLKQREGE